MTTKEEYLARQKINALSIDLEDNLFEEIAKREGWSQGQSEKIADLLIQARQMRALLGTLTDDQWEIIGKVDEKERAKPYLKHLKKKISKKD